MTSARQADVARIPLADGTHVAPRMPSEDLIHSLLAASEVLGTVWVGVIAAQVDPGHRSDGAAYLCIDAREFTATAGWLLPSGLVP